jgi:hypothetical protein
MIWQSLKWWKSLEKILQMSKWWKFSMEGVADVEMVDVL